MPAQSAIPGRKDLLLRIAGQFRELAAEIGGPFRAEAYIAKDETAAVLRVERDGQEDSVLRVVARIVDDGDGLEEKLALFWECKGEVTRLLGLGWTNGKPDASAGLDSVADHVDSGSVYAIGKVVHALRADILAELKSQDGAAASLLVPRRGIEPSGPARLSGASEHTARVDPEPMDRRADSKPVVVPDIGLLQAGLGELATKAGLKAENVFAGFIKAALSPGALKQGDVANFAQGAMLEVSIFYAAFLRNSAIRASDLGMEGGALRNAVVKAKAAFFEHDEAVRWQVVREMVTGMRLYYAQALASKGMPEAKASELLKSIFGRDAAIANEAIAILAQPEPAKQRSGLARLLGRNARE
ncbi:MAG: hypothetical protein ACLP7P_20390 [Rhodomicrobium sp.]